MKHLFWLLLSMSSTAALAGPYTDCVLDNVKGALTDQAVYAIKEACLKKASQPLPLDVLPNVTGTLAIGRPNFSSLNALYITLRNSTQYTITFVEVSVNTGSGVHFYQISRFDQVPGPGVISVGPPIDVTSVEKILPFSSSYFYYPADEAITKAEWNIVAASGFLN